MSNTSATGGYLTPTASVPLPGSLSLQNFLHSVIVGISGYGNTLVRPKWQVAPPKQPDIGTDWIAFGLQQFPSDSYAYVGMDKDGNDILIRNEDLQIQVAFYGPNAQENIAVFMDGFQIQQNLEALRLANMGFTECTAPIRGPDLVNERWIDRYEITVRISRQVQRTYAVLSFASAAGTIHTVIADQDIAFEWAVEEP